MPASRTYPINAVSEGGLTSSAGPGTLLRMPAGAPSPRSLASTQPVGGKPVSGITSGSTTHERTSLEALVYERLKAYADSLQGHLPEDMYRLIMPQLERPLIQVALELAGGEKKRAAQMLGIHRNTLRARLKELGLDDGTSSKRPGK